MNVVNSGSFPSKSLIHLSKSLVILFLSIGLKFFYPSSKFVRKVFSRGFHTVCIFDNQSELLLVSLRSMSELLYDDGLMVLMIFKFYVCYGSRRFIHLVGLENV